MSLNVFKNASVFSNFCSFKCYKLCFGHSVCKWKGGGEKKDGRSIPDPDLRLITFRTAATVYFLTAVRGAVDAKNDAFLGKPLFWSISFSTKNVIIFFFATIPLKMLYFEGISSFL